MQDFIRKIEETERAYMEENIRFNTERRMMDALAPEKWNELKEKIKATYPEMRSLNLSHVETVDTLTVNRYRGDKVVRSLTLGFDRSIPRIIWKCLPIGKQGSITFSLTGSMLSYVVEGCIRDDNEVLHVLLSCLSN